MGTTGTKYTSSVWVFFVRGPTCTKYVLYRGVGVRFMGTTGTRYTSSFWVFMHWVPNMSCIGVWGSDLCGARVPSILLLCGCFCNGYHGYQLYFFCVGVLLMGSTGTKYVVFPGVG